MEPYNAKNSKPIGNTLLEITTVTLTGFTFDYKINP